MSHWRRKNGHPGVLVHRRLRFSSDADIVRLANARIIIIIIIIIITSKFLPR